MKSIVIRRISAFLLAFCLFLGCSGAAEGEQYGYINAETKVYMTASEKGVVEGTVSLGTQVRIEEEQLSEDVGWYKVTFTATDKTGWVLADDVDLVIAKKAITAAPSAPEPGVSAPIVDEAAFPVLIADGHVDPDTLPGEPDPSQYHLIEVNQDDLLVPEIKARLNALGYAGGSTGTKLYSNYANMIKKFQKQNDMEEDGICSPEFQAKLFSLNAKSTKGTTIEPEDPIAITRGSISSKSNGGGTISFTVQNKTDDKIDAFDIRFRLYSTYGDRFLFGSLFDKVTIAEELSALDMSEERKTLYKGSALQLGISIGDYYFAGCMVAITAYHTASGQTVHIADDDLHWFAFGKGVEKDYQPRLITPLTDKEKELASEWDIGISGVYVDSEIAAFYHTREGMMINTMTPNSPADIAGLQAGDVLLAIGDTRIFGESSLARAMAAIKANETVTVLFFRNGSVWQTQLTRTKPGTNL